MQTAGNTGAAIPDTRGIPLPTGPRGGVHILERQPRRDPLASSPFRGRPIVEFTPDQLKAAGYRVAGTGTTAPKKARRTTEQRAPGSRQPTCDYDLVARLYTDEHLTTSQIAIRTGYAMATVRRALDAKGIVRDPARRVGAGPGFDVDEAIRLSKDGATLAELAQRFGYSVDHLGRTLRANGHSARHNTGTRTRRSFDHAAAVAMYLDGSSGAEVGRAFGVTHNAVLAAVKAAGHAPRRRTGGRGAGRTRATTPVDDIVRLYGEQLSPPQVAERLGVSPVTVRRVLARQGVPLRDDRATRSGGGNRHDQRVLRAAGELYTTGLTRDQVAKRLGIGVRAVDQGIALIGAHARPAANLPGGVRGHGDGARDLKDLMVANGITLADVQAWAAEHGHDCPDHGVPGRHLVEAHLLLRPLDGRTA